MNQIFISYSSKDLAWAQNVEERLRKANLNVYMDKTRLTAGKPFQENLFSALADSSLLLIVWSSRVRDMEGEWKEWVITEREQFRAKHPQGPIVYVLLDDENPKVDAQIHKLDQLRGAQKPADVQDSKWVQVTTEIKKIAYSDQIEINCYTVAATKAEFDGLTSEPNLENVLQSLNLTFDQVSSWYGIDRADWKPAGGATLKQVLANLESPLADVLKEDGVPERFRQCQIITSIVPTGLWSVDDAEVSQEIDRLARLDFCWIIVDPLSLYHPNVQKVASRIGTCADRNQKLNIFLIDPVGRILDRSGIRGKLRNDFSHFYGRLVKPKVVDSLSCLGGVDVWHADDFERVFRETLRLHRLDQVRQSRGGIPERDFASFGSVGKQ